MKDDQQLRAQDSDVLDETTDPALLRVAAQLDHDLNLLYTIAEPPPQLITAIRTTAQRQPMRAMHRSAWAWLQPLREMPYRLRAATIALLGVVLLGGAGYTLLPVLAEAFGLHTGTQAILTNNLGRDVTLSQTIEGFTITIERVYADANQIVIGYTITGPANRTFNNIMAWGELDQTPGHAVARSPILTDAAGNEIDGGLGGAQPGMHGNTAAALLTYDGVGIDNTAPVVQLHLRIGELSAYERLGDDQFRDVTVNAPFEFDLRVPVEPGRVATLHLARDVGGTVVTLERVVTTPTGTRVSLRGVGPNADVQLRAGGETYALHAPDGMAMPNRWPSDSQWEYIMGASLQDVQGGWELVVQPGAPMPGSGDPPSTSVTGGPWIFTFEVP